MEIVIKVTPENMKLAEKTSKMLKDILSDIVQQVDDMDAHTLSHALDKISIDTSPEHSGNDELYKALETTYHGLMDAGIIKKEQVTSVFNAIKHDDHMTVAIALAAGFPADIYSTRKHVDTILHTAYQRKAYKCFNIILGYLDPDKHRDLLGKTLVEVAEANDIVMARALLDKRADPNYIHTPKNATPLIGATDKENLEMCELLLSYEADIDHKINSYSDSPIVMAAKSIWKKDGAAILHMYFDAWEKKHKRKASLFDWLYSQKTIEILIERGADPNSVDNGNGLPLHVALRNGTYRTTNAMSALIRHTRNVNTPCSNGSYPIHYAIGLYADVTLVKLLLENKADPNAKNSKGQTALWLCTRQKKKEKLIEMLLDHGADINICPPNGKHALEHLKRNYPHFFHPSLAQKIEA